MKIPSHVRYLKYKVEKEVKCWVTENARSCKKKRVIVKSRKTDFGILMIALSALCPLAFGCSGDRAYYPHWYSIIKRVLENELSPTDFHIVIWKVVVCEPEQ